MLLKSFSVSHCLHRMYVFHQLNEWDRQKATVHMDCDRVKVFVLLAGRMVWEASGARVNVCEQLDWKRTLALHLCYGCGLTATVREVIDKYDTAFKVSWIK